MSLNIASIYTLHNSEQRKIWSHVVALKFFGFEYEVRQGIRACYVVTVGIDIEGINVN
jgi:hypothetical protein